MSDWKYEINDGLVAFYEDGIERSIDKVFDVLNAAESRIAELEEFKMIVEGCGFEVITEPPVLNHPERKILKGHGTIYVSTPPEVQE